MRLDTPSAMLAVLDKPALKNQAAPISIKQYHQMIDAGVLTKNDKVELLGGMLVNKMPKSKLHVYITLKLAQWLRHALPAEYLINEAKPLTLVDSEPEPDIAVVRGELKDYRKGHPETAEFVIEVAISSLAEDHDKADIYALGKIPQYLIIDGSKRSGWLYEQPVAGVYQSRKEIAGDVTLFAGEMKDTFNIREFCDWD